MSKPITPYKGPARLLHWGMALLILATIPAGVVMVQQGLDRSLQNTLFIFHKNVGVLLLILVVVRLAYRWRNPPAPLPAEVPHWQHRVSGLTHVLLYALLVLVPLAGYVRVKAGGFPIETLDGIGVPALVPRSESLANLAKATHYYAGIAIAVLIVLHIGAAAFHGIIRKDGVFSRMWPGRA